MLSPLKRVTKVKWKMYHLSRGCPVKRKHRIQKSENPCLHSVNRFSPISAYFIPERKDFGGASAAGGERPSDGLPSCPSHRFLCLVVPGRRARPAQVLPSFCCSDFLGRWFWGCSLGACATRSAPSRRPACSVSVQDLGGGRPRGPSWCLASHASQPRHLGCVA